MQNYDSQNLNENIFMQIPCLEVRGTTTVSLKNCMPFIQSNCMYSMLYINLVHNSSYDCQFHFNGDYAWTLCGHSP